MAFVPIMKYVWWKQNVGLIKFSFFKKKVFSVQQEVWRTSCNYRVYKQSIGLPPSFPTLPNQTHEMVDCWEYFRANTPIVRLFDRRWACLPENILSNQPFRESALEELEKREGAGTLFVHSTFGRSSIFWQKQKNWHAPWSDEKRTTALQESNQGPSVFARTL